MIKSHLGLNTFGTGSECEEGGAGILVVVVVVVAVVVVVEFVMLLVSFALPLPLPLSQSTLESVGAIVKLLWDIINNPYTTPATPSLFQCF
jgi:site-specific recombinase